MIIASNQAADSTRIWVYTSARPFSEAEQAVLNSQLRAFANQWTAHNQALSAFGEVQKGHFIVLGVDESQTGASGCSIDKSVHFIREISEQYRTDLFDRLQFGYIDQNEALQVVSAAQFRELYQANIINDTTLVVDTLVKTVGEMKNAFLKPLSESWHKRMV